MITRRVFIFALIFTATAAVTVLWRPWELTRAQWIRRAVRELREIPPPTEDFARSLAPGEWVGQGYVLFDKGWATFKAHTFHSSKRNGDVALLRGSDGAFYISHFHFCVGLGEYFQFMREPAEQQSRPRDIQHFLELYGKKHRWKPLPDS
jgi:hypothetical protein